MWGLGINWKKRNLENERKTNGKWVRVGITGRAVEGNYEINEGIGQN